MRSKPKSYFGSGGREGDAGTPTSDFASGDGRSDLLNKPKSYFGSGARGRGPRVTVSGFGSVDGGSGLLNMPKSDFGSVDGEVVQEAWFLSEGESGLVCEPGSSLGSSIAATFSFPGKGRLAMMCAVQRFCFEEALFRRWRSKCLAESCPKTGKLKFWVPTTKYTCKWVHNIMFLVLSM